MEKCACNLFILKNTYAATHHSVIVPNIPPSPEYKKDKLYEAVYPVAYRDKNSKEGNDVHGQRHSHLWKNKFHKMRWFIERAREIKGK